MKSVQKFPQLHPDAPAVPPGLRPREGVEYGCGHAPCRQCYERLPVADRFNERGDGRYTGTGDGGPHVGLGTADHINSRTHNRATGEKY